MARDWQTNRAQAISRYNAALGGGTISAAGAVPYGDYANKVNAQMTQAVQAPYIANLPGYLANITQRSHNTGAALRGELPQDVINLIGRQAAERGVATGSPGSANSNTAYLAALGLTSLGQQQSGAAQLSQSIQDTPVPQIFNPASIAVPEHLASLELNQAQLGAGSAARLPGSPPIVASSGPGRAPGMAPWGTGASHLAPGQAAPGVVMGGSNYPLGNFMTPQTATMVASPTNQAIQAIANGDFNQAMRPNSGGQMYGDEFDSNLPSQLPDFENFPSQLPDAGDYYD